MKLAANRQVIYGKRDALIVSTKAGIVKLKTSSKHFLYHILKTTKVMYEPHITADIRLFKCNGKFYQQHIIDNTLNCYYFELPELTAYALAAAEELRIIEVQVLPVGKMIGGDA